MKWIFARASRGVVVSLIWWLVACTPTVIEPPTLIPLVDTPVVQFSSESEGAEALRGTAVPVSLQATARPTLAGTSAVWSSEGTRLPAPVAVGTGVRPEDAQMFRPAEEELTGPVDWRPPPMAVPLSLHPDDHYWLIRPIPSGSRNFALEWYLYGNEPLLIDRLPYRMHHGLDFPNETGTPILAAGSGTVIHAGPLPSNRDGVNYYGNTVIILHDWQWQGQDVYTLYAHTLELFVNVGDYVEQGQLIAGVGASGEVSGPHLHLEVRVGQNHYNSVRNPSLWIAPYEGWGTLAGRFIDRRGRWMYGGLITVYPEGSSRAIRQIRAYMNDAVQPDDVWNENFVVADLPAGRYTVLLSGGGETFRRQIEVLPGQTSFIVVQADFNYFPSPTPMPTAIPPTATPTEPGEPGEPELLTPTP